ncbi:MAG TPA: oligosaccharide flippase family protein [Nitrolancea sp.]
MSEIASEFVRHLRDSADPATRGWFVMSAGSMTRLAIGLIASAIVARAFGPSNLGIYATLAAIAATTGAFCEFGLTESAVRRIASNWPRTPEAARATARSYLWLRLSASAIVVGLLLLALPLTSMFDVRLPRTSLVALALLGVVATGLCGATNGILQATGRFGRLSLVLITNAVLTAIAAIVLRLAGILTLPTALFVLGIGTSLICFEVGRRFLSGIVSFSYPGHQVLRNEGRALFGFGVWLWIGNSLAMGAAQLDLLLAAHWLTPVAVGTYALAVSLSSKASVLNQSLHAALLPFASSLRSKTAVRSYLRRGLLRSALIALLLLLAMPLARPVIPFIFGANYTPSVSLFLALLGVAITDLFAAPVLLLAFTVERPKLIAAADAARLIALLVTALLLVPVLGASGLVFAKLAASLAGFALTVVALGWRSWLSSPEPQFLETISER